MIVDHWKEQAAFSCCKVYPPCVATSAAVAFGRRLVTRVVTASVLATDEGSISWAKPEHLTAPWLLLCVV